ncbi:MAG: polysaccharide pyruvyl transferase family protein [Cyanobacteria bacterium]|nr:polysaccharide pyruvyl transferase family protein [Cyanobacteriota bacterium]
MAASQILRKQLHQSLEFISPLKECSLLNYPNYINLGDHLIWLGSLAYLHHELGTQIKYTASSADFSDTAMADCAGQAPIVLLGGGSLGDLWYGHQKFRESIVKHYRDRPIVILPQTMHFKDEGRLEQAAKIFNNHPQLTIFVRDRTSYDLAKAAFDCCQVLMAPDAAFQLTGLSDFPVARPQDKILYHCRTDAELSQKFSLDQLPLPVDISDWRPYEDGWLMGSHDAPLKQTLATLIREGWQRGLRRPREWRSRQQWQHQFRPNFLSAEIYRPQRQAQSWSFIHSAVYQFRQYRLIITNRLHGHILATLLGIPHVFLPNSYHKNQLFYETWTADLPDCKFVLKPEQIPQAVMALLKRKLSIGN